MSSLLAHRLIRTAAVEQVVAPFASHLCHLVLLCDSAEEPEQFSQLEEAAQAVARATENVAAVASRYVQCGVHWDKEMKRTRLLVQEYKSHIQTCDF